VLSLWAFNLEAEAEYEYLGLMQWLGRVTLVQEMYSSRKGVGGGHPSRGEHDHSLCVHIRPIAGPREA